LLSQDVTIGYGLGVIPTLNRRAFVKAMAAGAGTAALAQPVMAGLARWRFLTEDEALLVDAIAEQIIPADQDPGAHDAGVVFFIDRQLSSAYARHQVDYREGLRGVNQASMAQLGRSFVDLDWESQTLVLQKLEAGQAQGEVWKQRSSSEFFRLLRNHSLQGFYGSPRHGGNRNYLSYKMLGIDYPQYIGQNRYRKG
jgi:gluconate 2-dehydrogenase gamma chain